ncbi:alpha/beta hydrolase [Acinetobacter sp. ANC 4648]|uniref:alpha/beta hydrolase n=1 Tax=Acinetobacter sp. ANC 4648 TaxID=1977875 RepID=UPI000A34F2BC|nr:alpha/beta hydrolase [Acinetobacter sp. ANC 4648]OTG84925.1 6-hexanolactone hydrolase [Acinetobacter sp. ANC 4648]
MISSQAHIAMLLFKQQKRVLLAHKNNTYFMRKLFEYGTRFSPIPSHIQTSMQQLQDMQIMQISNLKPNRNQNKILFYIHGGGFVIGSAKSYKAYVASLCKISEAEFAYLPDYRLAPEARFPNALNDVLAAWKYVTEKHPNHEIVLAGDSAGGNLALALCIKLRDLNLKLPIRTYLQSPWLDLTLTSLSHKKQDHRDPFLGTYFLERDFARHYVGDADRKDPFISPLFADFTGLPPFYVQVGSKEVLLDDSREFIKRAKEYGVDATLDIWTGMWHAWPIVPFVPESKQARIKAGRWLASLG